MTAMIRMAVTPSVTVECWRVRPFIEDETEPTRHRYFDTWIQAENCEFETYSPTSMRHIGTVLVAASLAVEYGFTDIDGKAPPPLTLADV